MEDALGMSASLASGLAIYYLVTVLLNFGLAAYQLGLRRDKILGLVGVLFGVIGLVHMGAYLLVYMGAYLGGAQWVLSPGLRLATTNLMGMYGGQAGPILYTTGSVVAFAAFIYFRKLFTLPIVAWTILNLGLIAAGWGMTDRNFRLIVTKPDNVPITMLIISVGFFTWLAMRKAVLNDQRIAKGDRPVETLEGDKVLVWPDLVYTELIAMIVVTFLLVVWAVELKAPLEQPATSAKAPNPSKAPWYFLGLQEMLVYYDPWMAGIVLPLMIINGLIAIPFMDFNPKGNGYFTFIERKFAVIVFLLGFVVMWVTLIVLGTFLRGPNWNFFGPFEFWDPHKVLPLTNENLSEKFWIKLLGRPLPDNWIVRELPGIVLMLGYFALLPPLLARTVLRTFFIKMGFLRFMLLVNLLQFMGLLPLKMVLRWAINLKYFVYIPEYFFNI